MIILYVKDKALNPVSWRRVLLTCDSQYCWHASCGRHYRYMQPESVRRALDRTKGTELEGKLQCFVCAALQTQTSKYVPQVQAAADGSGHVWVPEAHCLAGGHYSPADMLLPLLRLAVQIDGPQHQFVPMYNKTLEQQQQTDRRFDNEIVKQGQRALRIHYKDAQSSDQPERVLAAAIALCQERPNAAFVMYSPSYNRGIKWAVDADHE